MIEAGALWLHLALAGTLVIGLIMVAALLFALAALFYRRLDRVDKVLDYADRRAIAIADTLESERQRRPRRAKDGRG